ncbi:uncharacterized protein BJ212DRAFT_1376342 [Suillus subaureus]|uniref:RNA polymerase II-associated protein 1 C-terminal domain-containing protein n=1 Tax=Suillus subaureus TaxID=48587 RepID=A0A9P7E4W4_9AGAM|nr:uncharacterized protein BJ212DRAFT_1376342 [Suillus subaureus]KAG1810852.1 hypothetical protein BJ212DRAFT_1376342 [Suillus subaureus]
MSSTERSLIGSVFERKTSTTQSLPSPRFAKTPGSGFPAVQHRSKSAFARAKEEEKSSDNVRPTAVPLVIPARPIEQTESRDLQVDSHTPDDAMRQQISEENERRVANMTEEEREQERREVLEQLGSGAGALLERVRAARSRKTTKAPAIAEGILVQNEQAPEVSREIPIVSPLPGLAIRRNLSRVKSLEDFGKRAPPILVKSSTRPSSPSKASRQIRFAALTPADVYVYESAPVSPKRKALALPPPPDAPDSSIVSLGTFKENGLPRKRPLSLTTPKGDDRSAQKITNDKPEPEEGTPEYIRRRYFPNMPADNPSVSWMKPSLSNSEPVLLRFDLTGAPIPAEISATLPSHLGLHHHADGERAGYTLDDIFFLSRSTVPAQRTMMLDILVGIAHRLGMQARDPHYTDRILELQGKEEELRKRILAAGLSAMNEKGGVGVRAIEVVWECIVGWNALFDAERAELDLAPAIMSVLQVPDFLTQATELFTQAFLPPKSLAQLLSIVYRLSQESNTIAESIVKTLRLLPVLLQTFLLTPIPPQSDTPLPNPVALRCLIVLASSSRTNAMALCGPADALLRFVTMLPPTSPFPESLATNLLIETLRLYATLASYGLYSHIATSAASYFASLFTYIVSSNSRPLKVAWAGLVEAWMVCATDPHHTTPPHDILWSQVTSWGWGAEVLQFRQGITEGEGEVWAAIWSASSAWLEGARVNGIRGGEGERAETLDIIQDGFIKGVEHSVVTASLEALRAELAQTHDTPLPERCQRLQRIGMHARVLSSAVRLWLACTSIANTGANTTAPLGIPPFNLPFTELSSFCAFVVSHSLWSLVTGVEQAACKRLATFLVYFHRLSRHIPGTSPDLWVAQGVAILERQLPGEEEQAFQILGAILAILTPQFLGSMAPPSIWEKGGWRVIKPFLDYAIRPNREVYIAPSDITPESIMRCTTLRLPSSSSLSSVPDEHRLTGLPLPRVWLTSPIDHLLRSGSSPVFKALSSSWDASEVDVVRMSLLLAKAMQEIVVRYNLSQFALKRSEMVFACMKVFMLEHGQQQEYPSPATGDEEEVFRDLIVSKLMSDLLAPFTLGATSTSSPSSKLPDIDLEQASLPFLGSGTPFYQFYTDFLALYDAISFSHPIFASLLLPPLALTYPIDYRRILWADFAHVLRTVRTPVDQVIAGDLRDFLYPIEKGEMIGKYAGPLLQGSVDGFLRLVGVHHVACNIWPDLRSEEVGAEQEDVSKKLLKMVVEKGDGRVVREVLRYRQVREEAVIYPPACFETSGEWIADRAEFARQVLGSELHERLQGVFYG